MTEPQAVTTSLGSPQDDYDAMRHVGPEVRCPYLPGRLARYEAFGTEHLEPEQYEALMDRGFRRSGTVVYRPRCQGCSACRPLRIPIADFVRTKSMRRVWNRNQDIRVEVGPPVPSQEKYQLYCDYLEHRHDGTMTNSPDSFIEFLYDSPTLTLEFCYFLENRLVGVGITDACPSGLSSVYFFADPGHERRSLGTFSVLWEVEFCRRRQLPYYYLGFYVENSRTMNYKARFRPHEILASKGCWQRGQEQS